MSDNEIVVNVDAEDQTHGEAKDDAVEDLKSQFNAVQEQAKADRERAEAAERRASQALQETNRAREEARNAYSQTADRDLDLVVSGLTAVREKVERAKADLRAAAEAGDFDKQTDAYERLAEAKADQRRLDEAKADIEVRRSSDSRASGRVDQREPVRREAPADRVEAFIQSRDADTQKWLRAHPDETRALILDPDSKQARKMQAAHNDAMAEGYREGSGEYFRHIESFVGLTKKEQTNGSTNGSGERQRRASPPAAPVSGGSNTGAGSVGGTEVRLSAGEAAAATDGTIVWNVGSTDPKTGKPIGKDDPRVGQPIGHREAARRKLAMQREGRYSSDKYTQ